MKFFLHLKTILLFCSLFFGQLIFCQDVKSSYLSSIDDYVKKYIATHEVVTGEDRKHLHFFSPDSNYNVTASFEKIDDEKGFNMPTSKKSTQQFYRYGQINFVVNGVNCKLTVYQSKNLISIDAFKNYLFIPFFDATNGTETYDGGRYIDILIPDIKNNKVLIDFNKAYNPYCCYTSGYDCPIPPKENTLTVAINAGEMKYTKPVH